MAWGTISCRKLICIYFLLASCLYSGEFRFPCHLDVSLELQFESIKPYLLRVVVPGLRSAATIENLSARYIR